MSPVEGYKQFMPQVVPMQVPVANIPPAVIAQQQQYQQPMTVHPVMSPIMVQAPMMTVQPQVMGIQSAPQQQQQYIPPDMIAQQQQMVPHTQPMMMVQPQPMVPQPQSMIPQQHMAPQVAPVPIVPSVDQFSNTAPLLESLVQIQPTVAPVGPLPAAPTPTPPHSGQASRSMSFSEKAPAVPDSP